MTDGGKRSEGNPRSGRPMRRFATEVTAADIRRFAGLRDTGAPPGPDWARQAGRKIAIHPLLGTLGAEGPDLVSSALERTGRLLGAFDLRCDVLRIRPGRATVRTTPTGGLLSAAASCELTRGVLETVPAMACGALGELMETTCRRTGAEGCLFTLDWDARLGATSRFTIFVPHGHRLLRHHRARLPVLVPHPDLWLSPRGVPPGRGRSALPTPRSTGAEPTTGQSNQGRTVNDNGTETF